METEKGEFMKFAKLALLPLALFVSSSFADDTTMPAPAATPTSSPASNALPSDNTNSSSSTTADTTTSSTQTTKKPVSKMTCEEFLVLDESYQPKVIYWVVGQMKNKKEHVDMIIGGTEKIVPEIVESCKKDPKHNFWSKVKAKV